MPIHVDENTHETRPSLTAIGMISGTSMDGIDVAVVTTDGHEIQRTGASATYPYEDHLQTRLRAKLGQNPDDTAETSALIRDVTDAHADALEDFMTRAGVDAADVDVVGFHGQTIFHDPSAGITVQLGDGQRLSDRIGIQVVADFRSADMAVGGEGAPFAPAYHAALARDLEKPICVLNLGGVANVTWIGDQGGLIAFDTGPASAMIDDWVMQRAHLAMDKNGEIARAGSVNEGALNQLLSDDYLSAPYPKSLDRDHFDATPVRDLSLEDGAATLSAFSAATVAMAQGLLPAPPVAWFVTGGGRHNPVLMAELRSRLHGSVDAIDVLGWHGDFLEAQAFGFLAVRSLYDLPLSFPGTTGVPKPTLGGVVHKPDHAISHKT